MSLPQPARVLYQQIQVEKFHPLTGAVPLIREMASFITIPEVKGYCQAVCRVERCCHSMLLHRNEDGSIPRSCKVFGCQCGDFQRREDDFK